MHSQPSRILFLAGIICSLVGCADGPGEEIPGITPDNVPAPEIDVINEVVESEFIAQNVVGGAVAVVRRGAIVHAKGYGYTSVAGDVPVTTDSIFRWASISKTVTAVAALQLDEVSENFSIDDTVTAHFSGWPNDTSDKSTVTVKHLLSNRSGVIHYASTLNCPGNTNPSFDRTVHGDMPFNAAKAVDVFDEQPLCFTPGSDYKYSTFGFSLAAAAIEAEANVDYAQWVQNRIATPLNMPSLTQGTGLSAGYRLDCGSPVSATESSKSYVLPGGGWASNIIDLAKFANGILRSTLLYNSERMWSEETGNTNSYRLGIFLSADNERAWHGGAHADLRTFMHLYHAHEDDVGIVVYLNSFHSNPERVAKAVANAIGVANWGDLGGIPTGGCSSGYRRIVVVDD